MLVDFWSKIVSSDAFVLLFVGFVSAVFGFIAKFLANKISIWTENKRRKAKSRSRNMSNTLIIKHQIQTNEDGSNSIFLEFNNLYNGEEKFYVDSCFSQRRKDKYGDRKELFPDVLKSIGIVEMSAKSKKRVEIANYRSESGTKVSLNCDIRLADTFGDSLLSKRIQMRIKLRKD